MSGKAVRPRAGRMLSISRPAEALRAYLVLPQGNGPFPGVVVIHELTGLTDQMKRMADRFAASGYGALAVDLFSGASVGVCMARLFHAVLIRPLANGVVADLIRALEHLGSLPGIDPTRLGVVGFCLGGSLALQLACVKGRKPKAAAIFYGVNPPLAAVARACPIVGSYPGIDFTTPGVAPLREALTRHGRTYDIRVYPRTFHSFMNEGGLTYDEKAAADAWARTLAFFSTHLAADAAPDPPLS